VNFEVKPAGNSAVSSEMAEPSPNASALYVHRGTRAVQRMVEYAPSSGGLALWVRHRDEPESAPQTAPPPSQVEPVSASSRAEPLPPVTTDGHTVFYAPHFERLPLPEQTGWVAHEVLHIALRHAQRLLALRALLGEVDRELFNLCADAVVNSALGHLSWLKLPQGAITLERLLSTALKIDQAVETSLLEWDVEQLYRALDDRRDSGRQGQREDGPRAARARALGASQARDLLPNADTAEPPEQEALASREWSERIARAHAGDGAHSLLRTLLADLPRSRTPWEQVLRSRLARALSPQPDASWSRPARSYLANQGRCGSRRMPFEPGFSASKAVPRLAVLVDVSGSISEALMKRFAREIEGITRRLQTGLVLIVGDERVQSVQRFAPGRSGLGQLSFQGGGGTDFTPLLEEAARHQPDLIVFLTDLDGPARFRPKCPVLWAVPERAGAAAPPLPPFGRVLGLR
jgi:predicted metal-dependent peptidase